ncbi:MAG: 30S ribosomal protein S18 [Thermodesulfobacteriota bacterium]|jgi:small subunit ribosomal protein S18
MENPKEKKFFTRKKICKFCSEGLEVDYKSFDLLSQFITERKKIVPRRSTGLCAYHQRELAAAIKRARIMALLPFTVLH